MHLSYYVVCTRSFYRLHPRAFARGFKYCPIKDNQHLLALAKSSHIVDHPLCAGAWTSGDPSRHIRSYGFDDSKLRPKPTALYYPLEGRGINIAEVNIRRLNLEAKQYGSVTYAPVINSQSKDSMQEVLQEVSTLPNLRVGTPTMQNNLMAIRADTNMLTKEHMAPGNHGQVGSQLLYEFSSGKPEGSENTIHVIRNGDGVNNIIPPEAAGYMLDEHAGIVIITTAKLEEDIKVGQAGVRMLPNDTFVPHMLELAEARENGQEELFIKTGRKDQDIPEEMGTHYPGEQYINTNTVLFNEHALRTFLTQIRTLLGEEKFLRTIQGHLYHKAVERNGTPFLQMETALASLATELNAKIVTDPELGNRWLEISGGKPFLRFINLEPEHRDKYFTPTKFPADHAVYVKTWYVDQTDWQLKRRDPDAPEIHIPDELRQTKDVQWLIDNTWINPCSNTLEKLQ